MTVRDRVLALLQSTALCDDCVGEKLKLPARQSANIAGRELEKQGAVSRPRTLCKGCRATKIVNVATGTSTVTTSSTATTVVPSTTPGVRPWSWEGNVQDRIIEHLKTEGWTIERAANTATREAGKDIVAKREGRRLWVSVKGYPVKSMNVQARHWFAGALFDLLMYRSSDPDVELGIGLPEGFKTYTNLLPRVTWAKTQLPFVVFWVAQSGVVTVE
jgi:hypothetical protein